MKFIKLLIILSGLSIILNSCGGLSEAGRVLRNDKSKSTDEFLIKKKDPLTQPPDFKNIPEPGSTENNSKSEKSRIEKILRTNKSESDRSQNKSSSTEESILNQIKK